MRRRLTVLGVLAGLLLVAFLLVPPSGERLPDLTVYSADPSGGKALRLWLDRVGYETATLEDPNFEVPDDAGTLLLLAPSRSVTTAQAAELEGWVRRGGRLVVVAETRAADAILGRFGLRVSTLTETVQSAVALEAGVLDPAIETVEVRADSRLIVNAPATRILGDGPDGERVFGARVRAGAGEVVALSTPYALSNEALRREENARLALSLVGPADLGTVVFDELHHGYGVAGARPLFSLLVDYSWGRAALLAGLLAFAYLAIGGRRFGRARPVTVTRGRSLGEYVTSLASLYRAGGKRAFAAAHFERRLRRELARAVGLPGDATDEQIEARARTLGRDPTDALRVLRALRTGTAPRESAMLALVHEAERARVALSRPARAHA